MNDKLRVLDLFSGIGGFSLGLERTGGFETVAFCEINEFCQKILAKHWPDVPIHEDIRELKGNEFGSVDLICGGYPCQPFSAAGKRRGEEDDRHLWPELHRIVATIRPRWGLFENVAGHISMGLDQVLSDLEGEDYTAWPFVVPACAVDAPHRRDRVWIIAYDSKELELREKNTSWHKQEDKKGNGVLRKYPDDPLSLWMVANDSGEGMEGVGEKTLSGFPAFSWCENVRRVEDYFGRPEIPFPLVCRSGDGISERLDAIGNSVVPQIPEMIGRAILETEKL